VRRFGRTYLSLNEQNCWLITCQTISSEDMMEEDGAIQLHRSYFLWEIFHGRQLLLEIEVVVLWRRGV